MVTYIGDATGWFKPVEGVSSENRRLTVEYFLAVAGCFFLLYCYIIHPHSMPPALMRTLIRGMGMNHDEQRAFECLRAINELELRFSEVRFRRP